MTKKHNERWLKSVAMYYNYHNIGERFILTFDDFAELVETERWSDFVKGIRLPEPGKYKTKEAEIFLHPAEDNTAGYSVRIFTTRKKERIVHYGIGLKAREKALKHLPKELQLV